MLSKLFKISLVAPFFYWIYIIFWGALGADPAKSLNHKTGEMALYFILLNLLIGILISVKFKWNQQIKFLLINRRFLGVTSFIYLVFHVFLYFAMESFEFKAVEQMVTKTYLIFAILAFFILFLLALTSNQYSIKKLKIKNWKLLHKFIYLASFFFSVHILLIEKADLKKYGILLGLLWLFQIARFLYHFSKSKKIKNA